MYISRRDLVATAFVCLFFTVNVKAQVSSEHLQGMSNELEEMTAVAEQLSTQLQGMSERVQVLAIKVNGGSDVQNNNDAVIDLTVGEAIYENSCESCHGPAAEGMASFPELTGQSADPSAEYLITRLEQYRAGEKHGTDTAHVMPDAANLSDEEINSVSQYIVESIE